jgi:hypothetical protein
LAQFIKKEAVENPVFWTATARHWCGLQQTAQLLGYIQSHLPGGFTDENIRKIDAALACAGCPFVDQAAEWNAIAQKHTLE